jgi:hypothetical protein
VGALIDLGGGLGATVTHHAVLGVGVDSRLAERARALVDGAGGVDEPVGGGALVSCPGDDPLPGEEQAAIPERRQ